MAREYGEVVSFEARKPPGAETFAFTVILNGPAGNLWFPVAPEALQSYSE